MMLYVCAESDHSKLFHFSIKEFLAVCGGGDDGRQNQGL
jgi:hypothetical protein